MITDYLLKHGCSGCVDDFRDHKYIFESLKFFKDTHNKGEQT